MSILNSQIEKRPPWQVLANWQLSPSPHINLAGRSDATLRSEAKTETTPPSPCLWRSDLMEDNDSPQCVPPGLFEMNNGDRHSSKQAAKCAARPHEILSECDPLDKQSQKTREFAVDQRSHALRNIDSRVVTFKPCSLMSMRIPGFPFSNNDEDLKSIATPSVPALTQSPSDTPERLFSLTEMTRMQTPVAPSPCCTRLNEMPRDASPLSDCDHAKTQTKTALRVGHSLRLNADSTAPHISAVVQDTKISPGKRLHIVDNKTPRNASISPWQNFLVQEASSMTPLLSFSSVQYFEIKALSEVILKQLKEKSPRRRRSVQRVFKPQAPSIFSITLPHVREDGSIVLGRDGYAITKPLSRGINDAEGSLSNTKQKSLGGSNSGRNMSHEEDAISFWRLPCGGLSVNQILQRLIDRETPSKQTLFTGLEVQRLMRGVPQASEFVVVLFWYVVFRGRRTWVEEILVGRCERLFVTFQELLPNDTFQQQQQQRDTLPPYEHLEILVVELEHMLLLRKAWMEKGGKAEGEEETLDSSFKGELDSQSQGDLSTSEKGVGTKVSVAKSRNDLLHEFAHYRCVYTDKYLPNVIKSKIWPREDVVMQLVEALDLLAVSREEYLELVQLEERTYKRLAVLFSEIFHDFGGYKSGKKQPAFKGFNSMKSTSSHCANSSPVGTNSPQELAMEKDVHPSLKHVAGKNLHAENSVAKLKMKDIVINTYLSIATRITYYTLVYCFPNDVYTGEIFDRRFRSDLLRLLLYWSSGVVLGHTPAVGWPVPCAQDFLNPAPSDADGGEGNISAAPLPLRSFEDNNSVSFQGWGWETPRLGGSISARASPVQRDPFESALPGKGGGGGGGGAFPTLTPLMTADKGLSLSYSLTKDTCTKSVVGGRQTGGMKPAASELRPALEGGQPKLKKGDKDTISSSQSFIVSKEAVDGANLNKHPSVSLVESFKGGETLPFLSKEVTRAVTESRNSLPCLAHRRSSKFGMFQKKKFLKSTLDMPKERHKGKHGARRTQLLGIGNGNTFNDVDVSIANGEYRLMMEFNHYHRHAKRLLVDLQRYTTRLYKINLRVDQKQNKRLEKSIRDNDAGNFRGSTNPTLKRSGLEKQGKEGLQNASSDHMSREVSREDVVDLSFTPNGRHAEPRRWAQEALVLRVAESPRQSNSLSAVSPSSCKKLRDKRVDGSAIPLFALEEGSMQPQPSAPHSHEGGAGHFSQPLTNAQSAQLSISETFKHSVLSLEEEEQLSGNVKTYRKGNAAKANEASLPNNAKGRSSRTTIAALNSLTSLKSNNARELGTSLQFGRRSTLPNYISRFNSFYPNCKSGASSRGGSSRSYCEDSKGGSPNRWQMRHQTISQNSKREMRKTIAQHALAPVVGLSPKNWEVCNATSLSMLSGLADGASLQTPTVVVSDRKGSKNRKGKNPLSPMHEEDRQNAGKGLISRGGQYSYLLSTYPLATCSNDAREYLCLCCGIRYSEVPIPEVNATASKAAYLVSLQRRQREQVNELQRTKFRHAKHPHAQNRCSLFSDLVTASSKQERSVHHMDGKGVCSTHRKPLLWLSKRHSSGSHLLQAPVAESAEALCKKTVSHPDPHSLFHIIESTQEVENGSHTHRTCGGNFHSGNTDSSERNSKAAPRPSLDSKVSPTFFFHKTIVPDGRKEEPSFAHSTTSDLSIFSLAGEIKHLPTPKPYAILPTPTLAPAYATSATTGSRPSPPPPALLSLSPFIVAYANAIHDHDATTTAAPSKDAAPSTSAALSGAARKGLPLFVSLPKKESSLFSSTEGEAEGERGREGKEKEKEKGKENPFGRGTRWCISRPHWLPPLYSPCVDTASLCSQSAQSEEGEGEGTTGTSAAVPAREERSVEEGKVPFASCSAKHASQPQLPPPRQRSRAKSSLTQAHPYRVSNRPSIPVNLSRSSGAAVGRLKHRVMPKLHVLEPSDCMPRPLLFHTLQKEALARERLLVEKVEMIANRSKISQQIYIKAHLAAMGNVQNAQSREAAHQFQRKVKTALNSL